MSTLTCKFNYAAFVLMVGVTTSTIGQVIDPQIGGGPQQCGGRMTKTQTGQFMRAY